jgi:hypothetical protein
VPGTVLRADHRKLIEQQLRQYATEVAKRVLARRGFVAPSPSSRRGGAPPELADEAVAAPPGTVDERDTSGVPPTVEEATPRKKMPEEDAAEDRPGYEWVEAHVRRDGVHVRGHWRRSEDYAAR